MKGLDINLRLVMNFLAEIGLSARLVPGAAGFLEGVRIVGGGLEVDPNARASNVLHEAGHLAVIPGRYRPFMHGDLSDGIAKMMDAVKDEHPDSPLWRSAIQASEAEATAWAWAAGVAIGLPAEKIILDEEYDGTGADIRLALSMRAYPGINGLAHAGWCAANPRFAHVTGRPLYPKLAHWLSPV